MMNAIERLITIALITIALTTLIIVCIYGGFVIPEHSHNLCKSVGYDSYSFENKTCVNKKPVQEDCLNLSINEYMNNESGYRYVFLEKICIMKGERPK